MQQAKTEAIILDTRDVFDTDRTYLMYTREFGKIWVRAKGVRRPTSKLTGHLLAYVPVQLEVVRAGQGYIVTQAQTLAETSGSPYPEDVLMFTQAMGVIGEIVHGLSADHDPQPRLYDVIKQGILMITAVMRSSEPITLLLPEVLLKIFVALGYQPELQEDIVTGEPLKEGNLAWSSSLGGVVQAPFPPGVDLSPLIFPRTILVMRHLVLDTYQSRNLNVSPEMAEEVARVTYAYVQYQLGKPINALQFLNQQR